MPSPSRITTLLRVYHPGLQVSQWKSQLLEKLPVLFSGGRKREKAEEDWQAREAQLFQKIGQLEVERDWLKKKLLNSDYSPEAM